MLILQFIQTYITPAIVVLGFVVFILLIWNGVVLSNKCSKINDALFPQENKYFMDTIKKELLREENADARTTPDKIRSLETDFNNACILHDVLVQLIPIFPLLGILGTVAGLMSYVQVGSNDIVAMVENMMSSMNTALLSTLCGIIAAIFLKFVEAVFPSRIINEVEIMLDDFSKRMNLADFFQEGKDV